MTKLDFNPDDLTLDELEEVEDLIGMSIDTAFNVGQPKGRTLKVFAFIVLRRDNPDITMEDVGAMKVAELELGEG